MPILWDRLRVLVVCGVTDGIWLLRVKLGAPRNIWGFDCGSVTSLGDHNIGFQGVFGVRDQGYGCVALGRQSPWSQGIFEETENGVWLSRLLGQ